MLLLPCRILVFFLNAFHVFVLVWSVFDLALHQTNEKNRLFFTEILISPEPERHKRRAAMEKVALAPKNFSSHNDYRVSFLHR